MKGSWTEKPFYLVDTDWSYIWFLIIFFYQYRAVSFQISELERWDISEGWDTLKILMRNNSNKLLYHFILNVIIDSVKENFLIIV